MGAMSNAFVVLVGKPELKKPIRRSGSRWECSMKMGLKEIGDVDWSG
jgi:hypothetical protein